MTTNRRRRTFRPVTYLIAAVSIGAMLLIGCGHAPRISGPVNPSDNGPAFGKLVESVMPNTGDSSVGGVVVTDNTRPLDGGFDVLDDNIVNDTPFGAGS